MKAKLTNKVKYTHKSGGHACYSKQAGTPFTPGEYSESFNGVWENTTVLHNGFKSVTTGSQHYANIEAFIVEDENESNIGKSVIVRVHVRKFYNEHYENPRRHVTPKIQENFHQDIEKIIKDTQIVEVTNNVKYDRTYIPDYEALRKLL